MHDVCNDLQLNIAKTLLQTGSVKIAAGIINRLIIDTVNELEPEAPAWQLQKDIFMTEHWRRRGVLEEPSEIADFNKEFLRDGVDDDGWHPFFNPISTSDKGNTINLIDAIGGMDDIFPRQHPSWLVDRKTGPFAVALNADEPKRPLALYFEQQSN